MFKIHRERLNFKANGFTLVVRKGFWTLIVGHYSYSNFSFEKNGDVVEYVEK